MNLTVFDLIKESGCNTPWGCYEWVKKNRPEVAFDYCEYSMAYYKLENTAKTVNNISNNVFNPAQANTSNSPLTIHTISSEALNLNAPSKKFNFMEFSLAIRENDVSGFKKMLSALEPEEKEKILSKTTLGTNNTLLDLACDEKVHSFEMAEELVSHGADFGMGFIVLFSSQTMVKIVKTKGELKTKFLQALSNISSCIFSLSLNSTRNTDKNNFIDLLILEGDLQTIKSIFEVLSLKNKNLLYSGSRSVFYHALSSDKLEIFHYLLNQCDRADVLDEALKWRDLKGKNLLHLSLSKNNLSLAETLIEKKTDLARETDDKGWNIYHYLGLMSRDTQALVFFKKYFPLYPQDLDAFSDPTFDTPLNFAKLGGHNQLEKVYLEALSGEAPNTTKRYFSKGLSHVWAIENSVKDTTKEPYLKELKGWSHTSTAFLLYNNMGEFLQEKNDGVISQLFFWILVSLSNFFLGMSPSSGSFWLHPLTLKIENEDIGHTVVLVKCENQLIICDRSPVVNKGPFSSFRLLQPGFKIYELPPSFSEEEAKKLVQSKFITTLNLMDYLKTECKAKLIEEIKQPDQPVGNCSWTNMKGAAFAGLYMQLLKQNSALSKDQAYQQAHDLYQQLGKFVRFNVLKKYKKEVSASDPLVEAIELKACINHIVKFLRKLKDKPAHFCEASLHSMNDIKNNLGKSDIKIAWIQSAVGLNIPGLNESIQDFVQAHDLSTIVPWINQK